MQEFMSAIEDFSGTLREQMCVLPAQVSTLELASQRLLEQPSTFTANEQPDQITAILSYVKQMCLGYDLIHKELQSKVSSQDSQQSAVNLCTVFGFSAEITRLVLVRLAQSGSRRGDNNDASSVENMFETYIQVVNRAIQQLCKANQFSEAALVCERADDLRNSLPTKYTKIETAQSSLLAIEAVHLKKRVKLLTLQALASFGVFVVKNDQFSVDLESVVQECEAVTQIFSKAFTQVQSSSNVVAKSIGGVLCSLAASVIKKLDRLVTETAGCDSFVKQLMKCAEKLVELIPEKAPLKEAILKKFRLVTANAWLKVNDYENASKTIELCCSMIHKGERDELKVYFLAFKMHCQLRDKEEAIETFQSIFNAPQVSAEPILECFNVLVQCQLFDVALGLGGHLLKACEKFIVDAEMKKRFLLKFLFAFDLAIMQHSEKGQEEQQSAIINDQSKVNLDAKQIEQVIVSLVETLTKLVSLDFMKVCSSDELKVVFYSIWNLAYEAKSRELLRESQTMLAALYEQVKRFAQYCHEQRMNQNSDAAVPSIDEELMKTIVYRTLSLMADLHVHSKNFQAARTAIQDLERLQRNDAETYILKIRVLLNESLAECSNFNSLECNTFSKRQPNMAGTMNMAVFSKRSQQTSSYVADRIQQEIMDSISNLHKCDNFHFAHLLVVMYEADQIRMQFGADDEDDLTVQALAGQTSQKVLQVLIDFILSFIQQNKQSIIHSLHDDQHSSDDQPSSSGDMVMRGLTGSQTSALKDFTFARFLISCAHENTTSSNDCKAKEAPLTNVDALLRYLKPLHTILSKSALLKSSNGGCNENASQPYSAITHVERREELRLLVSFEDCKWICDTLWKHFFAAVSDDGGQALKGTVNNDGQDLEKLIEGLDLRKLTEKQHILEESVLYARIAALMVEADLQERQNASNIFTFESQNADSQTSLSANATGLFSEDSMIEEAVQLNELSIMGSMLMSLIRFDTACQKAPEASERNSSLVEEQTRNQVLTDLKVCDGSLQSVIDQCKLLIRNLDQFQQLFDSQSNQNSTKLQLNKLSNRNQNGAAASKITINMAKLKNKKTLKKVQKLRDFASNSYSYLQVILFQCKVRAQRLERNPNPHEIESLIQTVLSVSESGPEQDLVRANSLKMMYSMLRDSKNLYPQMQKRLLRRFIEKQVCKLRQYSEQQQTTSDQEQQLDSSLLEGQLETFNELLSAHKELIELSNEHADRFAFLSQASRLMDQALTLTATAEQQKGANKLVSNFCDDESICDYVNLDFLKWMLSFAWNQGVQCFQKEGDREMGKRYFQFSTQLLMQVQRLLADQDRSAFGRGNKSGLPWQELQVYIDAVGPRMEQVHQKVLYNDIN